MTSKGVGGAGPATRAPRAEVERARREKRTVGQAGVEVPDTGREKRARQTTIDEMYAREKLVEFTNAWPQWIYVKKLPFNAFRGSEFQRVRQAAERVPRSIQFRFPSYRVTAGADIPSQRAKVAAVVSEVRATFRHSGGTILSDGRKSRSGKPLVNFLAGGANGALLYATVARNGSVRDTADVVYRRWRTIILSFERLCDLLNRTALLTPFLGRGDSETERCAAWWFEHGRAHPELCTIAIRVMHLWTSASLAERNWAEHERVSTSRRLTLGFAKLAQLVEIATNLKLASCARQGGGYVLPWVMGTGRGGMAAEEEDEEGNVEPEVWGARPDGSVLKQEIQRQIVAFRDSRPSRARSVRDVFGSRATKLRPWPEGGDAVDAAAAGDDIDDDRTDDDDTPLSRDPTADCRAGGGFGGRSHAEVRMDDSGEQQPRGGLRHTGRRWEVRSDSEAEGEAEDKEVPLRDRRFSPSHHPISAQPEALRRSERLASATGRDQTHDGEDRGGERTPPDVGIRPRLPSVLRTQDFEDIGLGGSLGDLSVEGHRRASPQDVRTDPDVEWGPVDTEEERDARLDREEEERLRSLPQWEGRFTYLDDQRRQRDLETGGGRRGDEETTGVPEGQDVVMGGGSPSGGRGDSETAGDEGQGAAVCGRGEGGPGGDEDTAGVGGDDGPDGDNDDDHGPEDDPYRLALVLRDPTVPPLRPADTAHTFFDADALAHALTNDPFAHVSRKSGKQRAPGRVYSSPPFTVQSPDWSGSSLSDIRGRESGAGEVGSGRRSDGGRDSAGSMPPPLPPPLPPPPTQTPEARVDTGDRTVAPGVVHSGGSPPRVRGGVGGGWSAVRRVGDQLRADYNAGRGVFTGRTPVQTKAAESWSGRPSLQMAGRMLGLSRAETRRTLVLEAAGTSTDRLRGE
ncbi:hypothetical protein CBR_g37518 [Chara braunii]|uniref:Uncharacterized protein n=1 Tax=Chara braunii TaxID=69332 RepID=A0A388LN17_CHABU|nr:hypothetical protein CBR_g37518 [Chara braunii]|eukprot:GBG83717.1 hypothetical protein CBR_g37518 [Chara braunii]